MNKLFWEICQDAMSNIVDLEKDHVLSLHMIICRREVFFSRSIYRCWFYRFIRTINFYLCILESIHMIQAKD